MLIGRDKEKKNCSICWNRTNRNLWPSMAVVVSERRFLSGKRFNIILISSIQASLMHQWTNRLRSFANRCKAQD